jgi:predicted transposase/invertase (TIGR01784 family)
MPKEKKQETNEPDDKQINNPHDKFIKFIFTMKAVVKDYFIHLFPKHLFEKLDIETLELDTTSYITPKLAEYYSDIVWRCQYRDKKEFAQLCFIIEHKSYIPPYPNVQIGDYKQGAYNTQIKMEQPLRVVMPIIVYHGTNKWEIKPFSSYFGDIDEGFHTFIDPLSYYLTDLSDYPDEMIKAFNTIFLGRALLALKHFKEQEYIRQHFVELLFVGYESNNSKEEIDFVRSFYLYLYTILGGITVEEINQRVEEFNNNHKSEVMENYIDYIIEKSKKEGLHEGLQEGLHEGRQKGRQEGIEIGKKLSIFEAWQRGCEIELLMRIFALSKDEILNVIEEMKNAN